MVEIALRGGSAVVLVDDEDEHHAQHRWYRHSRGYAYRRVDGTTVYLHRMIAGLRPGDGLYVDHINRNPLDDRRANLRVVTPAGNAQNRAGLGPYRGVCFDRRTGLYYAKVEMQGVQQRIGGRHADPLPPARAAEAFRRAHMPYAVPDHSLDPVGPCPCRECAAQPRADSAPSSAALALAA